MILYQVMSEGGTWLNDTLTFSGKLTISFNVYFSIILNVVWNKIFGLKRNLNF